MSEDPLAHLPLVRAIAYRTTKHSHGFEYDDAVQIGCIGLLQAIATYDPARGKFAYHAIRRISGALQDELRKRDTIPRNGERRGFTRPSVSSLEQPYVNARSYDGEPDAPFEPVDPVDDIAALEEQETENELHRRLPLAIASLSSRDQRLLKLRYRYGRRFVDIGSDFGVTESRACQLHKAAIKRLRKLLGM